MKRLFMVLTCVVFCTSLQAQCFADRVILDAKIWTVDEKNPEAEAMACLGERILAVGTAASIKKYIGPATIVWRLHGKRMLPGFIDNHVHFVSGGLQLLGIDLRQTQTPAEFIRLIQTRAANRPGTWITGGDWDHENWPNAPLPTRVWLDPVTANTPVFVSRFDGHMGVANSVALARAGITKDTPNPPGGEIVRDPQTGEPTGVLKDEAMNAVYGVIPAADEAECTRAAVAALQEAARHGVTSLQDLSSAGDLRIYQKLRSMGKLSARINSRLPIYEIEAVQQTGLTSGFGDSWLRFGGLKAFADGSLGSSTALFYKPYEGNPTGYGLASDILLDGRLEKWILQADGRHLQVSTHAIGDSANSRVLDFYEQATVDNPTWDRRHRIEHAQHLADKDIRRFAQLGVIAAVHPYHLIDDGRWAIKRIGAARCREAYPIRSLLDSGAMVSFGTDWTVAPINPLWGIYAAVTRRTLDGKNPQGWIPEQKISVAQAVRCYTLNSAYSSYEENDKGLLKEGYLADWVVLSDDIFAIDPVNIWDVQIEMTVVGGKVVYQR
jgi:predicted amidohydrolase YtcJ